MYNILNNHAKVPSQLTSLTTKGDLTAYVQSVNPVSRDHHQFANVYNVIVKVIAGKQDLDNQKITVQTDSGSSTFYAPQLKAYESTIVHVGLILDNPNSVQLIL